jgi:hypothetical protein
MSADAGAVAHACAADEDRVSSLPAPLVLNIFSRLTADERARCATVRRSWRAAVSERRLWTRLDLSATSGVTCTVNDAALVAAATRAGGSLEALDLSGRYASSSALLAVATANSETLLEMRCADETHHFYRVTELELLLRAAPRLRVLETCAVVKAADAGRMLRNEPPFEPLRLKTLCVRLLHDPAQDNINGVLALAAGVLAHAAPLVELELDEPPLYDDHVLDAVVDAVLARRVQRVAFEGSWMGVTPASIPALVRLLGSEALQELRLCCDAEDRVLDNAAAALLGAALRANTTLASLRLSSVLCHNTAATLVLLRALTAHPSVRKLDLSYTHFVGRIRTTYEALGALVAANTPALRELSVHRCSLRDAGLGPLLDALPANTHLRVLDCSANSLSSAFVRNRLLRAVRANSGLRQLTAVTQCGDDDSDFETDANPGIEDFERMEDRELACEFQAEAEALVAARGGGGAA